MKSRAPTRLLLTGLIVVGVLLAVGGRTYAATTSPFITPTAPLAPTPVAAGRLASNPNSVWVARELDPIIIPGGWSSVVRVWVQGQFGLPVTIRSSDGNWSTVNFVGSKPEYGPDALEFAPLWPGRYLITPEGLGVSYTLELAAGRIAQVRFEPGTVGVPPAALAQLPSPSPSPALTPTPTPDLRPPISLAPAPALAEPPDGTAVSLKIRLDLAWTWDGALGPDDYFRVEIWNNSNEFGTPIDVAWVKALTYRHDGSFNVPYGPEYRWRITAIRGIPAREKDWSTFENQVWEPGNRYVPISEESETWILIMDPGCQPGDRDC